jgi:hypothetical protein
MRHLVISCDFKPEQVGIQTELLQESSSQIPGSVFFSIKRFARPRNWMADDIGMVQYHFSATEPASHRLELKFCTIGNMYCRRDHTECSQCRANASHNCEQKVESVDFISFIFSSTLLSQFVKERMSNNTLGEQVLSFSHRQSFSRTLGLCGRTRMVLDALLNHNYSGNLENIFINAQTQMLLLYCLDCMDEKQIDVINCKFLANEPDREKVMKAREILLGTTIFDFYQSQRMEHAKYLLYEKGMTVTEVSIMLGYSSISHFSTAFKKHTGLKPCELLFH